MPESDRLGQSGASDPMPVFTIKAKDNLALRTIWQYKQACEVEGLHDQAAQVRLAYREVIEWRKRHPDECKMPDHQHVPATPPKPLVGADDEHTPLWGRP